MNDGTPDPTAGLAPPPAVSMKTIAVTGILVDVFGLEELPSSPAPTHVSVLWLHNPRLGDRTRMAPIAKRVVAEYNKARPSGSTRGLIAAAFGMLDFLRASKFNVLSLDAMWWHRGLSSLDYLHHRLIKLQINEITAPERFTIWPI